MNSLSLSSVVISYATFYVRVMCNTVGLNSYLGLIAFCKNLFYTIASRAAQSNSVYESVLKISIVHADRASKSLGQNFFFARAAIVSEGKKCFATIMDTNRDSAHQS